MVYEDVDEVSKDDGERRESSSVDDGCYGTQEHQDPVQASGIAKLWGNMELIQECVGSTQRVNHECVGSTQRVILMNVLVAHRGLIMNVLIAHRGLFMNVLVARGKGSSILLS